MGQPFRYRTAVLIGIPAFFLVWALLSSPLAMPQRLALWVLITSIIVVQLLSDTGKSGKPVPLPLLLLYLSNGVLVSWLLQNWAGGAAYALVLIIDFQKRGSLPASWQERSNKGVFAWLLKLFR